MRQRQKCFICEEISSSVEMHHVWPQFAGGEAGPVVALCANCHSGLHRQALNLVSKSSKRRAYFTAAQMERAKPLVQAIVVALIQAKENRAPDQEMTVMFKLPAAFMMILHSLKVDSGHTNLNTFIAWVLREYAKGKV